jgi:hypothetical protein
MAGNRGSKPSEKRGGRPIGAPNKETLAFADTLEVLVGDPIEGMARIVMDEPAELAYARMYKELAQYVACKKVIEVSSEEAGPVPIKISWAQW